MLYDELIKGVVVIIDDEINSNEKKIQNIKRQIEEKNIPVLAYERIPDEGVLENFKNLAFLLLDWKLVTNELTEGDILEGATSPPGLEEFGVQENIRLIKKISETCYCPIFIFSNEAIDDIKDKLEENELYNEDEINRIFIQSKSDLRGRVRLFKKIEQWLNKNPSFYVLKKWENEYRDAINTMYSDFQKFSPVWPKILWKNYKADRIDPSLELSGFITNNLHTRISPFDFSDAVLSKKCKKPAPHEFRAVIEGERFISNDKIPTDSIMTGDIFKRRGKYYLNIRAACDLIPNRGANGDNVDLYLVTGTIKEEADIKKMYDKKYGLLRERDNEAIYFPIEQQIISFNFQRFKIGKWNEYKEQRIGRLLPPFITRIQQKFSLYIQRVGLPRVPNEIVN